MAAGLAASVLSAGAQDVRQAREMRARGPLPRTAYQGRSRPEQTERRVAETPLTPDAFPDAADDLAVEEVHQVNRKQDDECIS